MIFDEALVHESRNETEKTRLILFCDVTRLQKNRLLQSKAEWLSNKIMSDAVSPNTPTDKTSFINCPGRMYWTYDNNRSKLKVLNKNVFLQTTCMLSLAIAFFLVFYI